MSEGLTGLSVLIPNYDWDITRLIQDLHNQLTACDIPFEILCFDDSQESSYEQVNSSMNKLEGVTYKVNEETLGRSLNRNHLTERAKYEQLIFLDGDADIAQNQIFIQQYLDSYDETAVICGGTAYAQKPTEATKLLRYLYGKNREELTARQRNTNPWAGFSAFNFSMCRSLFLSFGFSEHVQQYGHEDTLFGNELKYRCVPIKHIDNPAIHLGLDTSEVFIEKSKKAVENLRDLIDKGLVDEDVKLYAWFVRAKKSFMKPVLASLFAGMHKVWERNLCGKSPNLNLFDLYRLSYLCSLTVNHKTAPPKKIKI